MLSCTMQECLELNIKTKLASFIFNYEKVNYIISVHHGLPISDYKYNNQQLEIYKHPIWNELIIFNTNDIIIDSPVIFKKIKIKLPISNDLLYIKTVNLPVNLSVVSQQMINLHHLPTNPSVIYIYAHVNSGVLIKSMSGSAVYDDKNKLVGIILTLLFIIDSNKSTLFFV